MILISLQKESHISTTCISNFCKVTEQSNCAST